MDESKAQRRLVKSPPELWAEVSSEALLGRRLAAFGEIRITRVDPETTVAWEGDRASGTVELAPAGWGTKVVLTATPIARAPALEPNGAEPEPEPEAEPLAAEPESEPEASAPEPAPTAAKPAAAPAPPPPAPVRRGFLARLFRRRRTPAPAAEIPAPGPPIHDPSPPAPAPDPTPPGPGPDPTPPTPPPDPVPPAPDPMPPPSIEAGEPPDALGPERTVAILTEILDDLGSAHRRIVLHD
jgi:hypothetical protein